MSRPAAPLRTLRAGDLVMLAVLASLVAIYGIDAVRASTDIRNLILVLPLSVVLFTLCVAQFVIGLRERARGSVPQVDGTEQIEEPDGASLASVLRVVGLFAAYVLTLPWLGFDVGTCLFLAAFLILHGERHWFRLAGFSVGFGLAIAFFFSQMLPYPMPMLLLGSG